MNEFIENLIRAWKKKLPVHYREIKFQGLNEEKGEIEYDVKIDRLHKKTYVYKYEVYEK